MMAGVFSTFLEFHAGPNAYRPYGAGLPLSCFREEGRIRAAVEAGCGRCARDAPVDELGGLGVVPALLLAYGGSDVFGCSRSAGLSLSVDSFSKM